MSIILLVGISLSLSLLYATQVSESVFKWEAQLLYLYSFFQLTFNLIKSAPLNSLGQIHLGNQKTIFNYIHYGTIDLTYNGGFNWWLYDDQLK